MDPTATLTPPVGPRDHAQGSADAPVTLVEYGDYECPFCGEAYGIVKQLQADEGSRLRFVFRNFPLTQSHPFAEKAAEAAEAAGAQGKFWEMHDMLYEHQDALEPQDLIAYATELGLDVERFTRDLDAGTYAERVREDFMSGVRSGVNGTPTFFINGRRLDAGFDLETLETAVNAAAGSRRGA
ncbi:MAG: thioredoxin domain-containing protein [Thermomicrobiales bacterium]|nr:thioredoxin domain-containing protein [Thermomicrobiales bacterium]